MLRRQPTQIKLTSNDLAAYEDFKKAQNKKQQEQQAQQASGNGIIDPRTRQRTREERIGLGPGAGIGGRL